MNRCVSTHQENALSTAAAMHETAEALERSEAILHESAEKSPDEATRRRLHRLGDEVTRQAVDIDQRADLVTPPDGRRVLTRDEPRAE